MTNFVPSLLEPPQNLRKAAISFVMSVRPPARNSSDPTGRIFVKFDSGAFKKKRVALIMLIIALQFDVSTSTKKKKRVALIMLIIALMN